MEYYQKSAYRSNKKYKQKSSGGLPDLLLFYILPFIVFNSILFYCVASSPKINLEIQDTKDYLSPRSHRFHDYDQLLSDGQRGLRRR